MPQPNTSTPPAPAARMTAERREEIDALIDVRSGPENKYQTVMWEAARDLRRELDAVTRERDELRELIPKREERHRYELDFARSERDEARQEARDADRLRILARCYGQRSAQVPASAADSRLCDQKECARCWRKRAEAAGVVMHSNAAALTPEARGDA